MSSIWAAPAPSRGGQDFAKGEFRFVAQAVSHLVFADP
jgi:alkyl sulfatase BDS1-like metallo-beta-lactamase superfamily hydrolase